MEVIFLIPVEPTYMGCVAQRGSSKLKRQSEENRAHSILKLTPAQYTMLEAQTDQQLNLILLE